MYQTIDMKNKVKITSATRQKTVPMEISLLNQQSAKARSLLTTSVMKSGNFNWRQICTQWAQLSCRPHIDDVIEVNGGSKDRVNNEPNNDATKGCHRNHIVGVDRVSNEPANAHSNNATDMVTTIP